MPQLLKKVYAYLLLITVMLFMGGQQLHCYAGHDVVAHSHGQEVSAAHQDCVFCSVNIQFDDYHTPQFSSAVIVSDFVNASFCFAETLPSQRFYFSLRAPPVSA